MKKLLFVLYMGLPVFTPLFALQQEQRDNYPAPGATPIVYNFYPAGADSVLSTPYLRSNQIGLNDWYRTRSKNYLGNEPLGWLENEPIPYPATGSSAGKKFPTMYK
jgi:hypothetical protein